MIGFRILNKTMKNIHCREWGVSCHKFIFLEQGPFKVDIGPVEIVTGSLEAPNDLRREKALEARREIRKELTDKKASAGAVAAFDAAYDRSLSPTIKRILDAERGKGKLSLSDPEVWERVNKALMDESNPKFYSKVYAQEKNMVLDPLVFVLDAEGAHLAEEQPKVASAKDRLELPPMDFSGLIVAEQAKKRASDEGHVIIASAASERGGAKP